jgi:hypothetical protein
MQTYDFRKKDEVGADELSEFKATNRLNQYPLNSSKVARNPKACIVVYTNHINMWDEFESDEPEKWLLQRRSLIQQIKSYKGEIVVAGRTDYFAGMTIELECNTVRNHTIDPELAVDMLNKGKYLVTSIMWRIAKNECEAIMTLARDSIITDLG